MFLFCTGDHSRPSSAPGVTGGGSFIKMTKEKKGKEVISNYFVDFHIEEEYRLDNLALVPYSNREYEMGLVNDLMRVNLKKER